MKRIITKSWQSVSWLREFLQEAPDGEYLIQDYSPPRNIEQNALLHAYLTYIARGTGNEMYALKELMKKKYASKKKMVKIGWKKQYAIVIEQTSKMNKKRFAEFLTDVEWFFTPFGYPIPSIDNLEFRALINSYS